MFLKKIIVSLINLYQKTISPDHGFLAVFYPHGFCRYTPSCSEYAKQALLSHGTTKGALLSFKRILRCNPWSGFGKDPVPQKNHKHFNKSLCLNKDNKTTIS